MSSLKKHIKKFSAGIFVFLMLWSARVDATHIVGADMTFTCNAKEWYEISLTVRRDCINGDPEAVFDDPAFVGIFDAVGTPLPWLGTLGAVQMELVSINDIEIDDPECTPDGNPVCVSEARYTGQVFLPLREKGYVLGYQRCCRNATLTNILNPLETGNTSFVCITEEALNSCNSSPVFGDWPDIFICNDEPLVFDASATDADGDELRYMLFTPHTGASQATPQPIPPAGPPYDEVIYAPGFSLDDPLGGGSNLTIDPNTGVLRANPTIVGQFLVGILVEEIRDGVSLSKTRRNFEYNVRDCSSLTGVRFNAPDVQCDGLTVTFENTSTDTRSFSWNFNFPSSDPVFMSTEENPSFTFPEPGTYMVRLSTDDESVCRTDFTREVRVVGTAPISSFEKGDVFCDDNQLVINVTSSASEPNSTFSIASSSYEVIVGDEVFTFDGSETELTVPCGSSVTVIHTVVSTSGCDSSTEMVVNDIIDLDGDDDGDGVTNGDEIDDGTDPNDPCDFEEDSITLPQTEPYLSADCDGDGVTNGDEIADGTDPFDPCDFNEDSITLPQTEPFLSADCDGDGVTNGDEIEDGTDIFDPCDFEEDSVSLPQMEPFLSTDCDGDGVTNGDEIEDGTDPFDPCDFLEDSVSLPQMEPFLSSDCDGDGVTNEDEIEDGTDPFDPCDFLEGSVTLPQMEPFLSANCDAMLRLDFVGNPIVICEGTSTRIIANPNPEWTYTYTPMTGLSFPDGNSNPVASPTVTTTYTVSVTDGVDTITENVTVEVINEFLDIGIVNNGSDCGSEANLSAVDNNNTGASINYDWSFDPAFSQIAAQGQNVVIPLPTGTTTIYLRAGGVQFCGSNVPSITLNGIDSGLSAQFDGINTCVASEGSVSIVGDPTATVVWEASDNITTGLEAQTVLVRVLEGQTEIPLTYTVTTSDGCTFTESIVVPVEDEIVLSFADGNSSCGGEFTANANVNIDDVNVEWSLDPSFTTIIGTGPMITVNEPTGTLVYLRGSTDLGCVSDIVSAEVGAGTGASTSADIPSINTCVGNDGVVSIVGDPGASVVWEASDNITSGLSGQTIDVVALDGQEEFDLTYTVTTSDGCTSTQTVTVPISSDLVLDIAPNGDGSCEGGGSFSATANVPIDSVNIEWSLDPEFGTIIGTGSMIEVDDPVGTLVYLRGSTDLGCTSEVVSTEVTEGAGEFMVSSDLDPNQASCVGDTIATLSASTNGGTIVWTDDAGNMIGMGETIMVDRRETTTATATVVDENGCPDSLVFNVESYEFDLMIDGPEDGDPICMPTVNLNVLDNTGADISYMWVSESGGVVGGGDSASPTIDVTNASDLFLVATNNALGCMDTFPFPVSGFPGIMVDIIADPGTSITEGDDLTLTATTDAEGPTFLWDTGETTPSISPMPTETTTYCVTVTDVNGCDMEQCITIEVTPRLCSTFDVPAAFTPNGDNNNDELVVRSDGDLDELDFQILDRWGNEVFRSTRQDEGWNGRHQQTGSELSPDVFAYCIKVTCNGVEEVKHGNVSLIR